MDEKKESYQEIDTEAYAAEYSEPGLWEKIRDNVASIGLNLISSFTSPSRRIVR